MKTQIKSWDLTHRVVFLRFDGNVPLDGEIILDDARLIAIKPTLDLLRAKQARIIMATHIGRPQGHDTALSTKPLAHWFTKQGHPVVFVADIADVPRAWESTDIVLLENLRFDEREENDSASYARELAAGTDYYVNDAFGSLHRADTSLVRLPLCYPPERRTWGLLVERELAALRRLVLIAERPFYMCIGGGKVADKFHYIKKLMTKADKIFLCPALSIPFHVAQGLSVGLSPYDEVFVQQAHALLTASSGASLLLPIDYLVGLNGWQEVVVCAVHEVPAQGTILAIGPKTAALWDEKIAAARMMLFNGPMGDRALPETTTTLKILLESMAASPAYTVIAGGDAVAAVHSFGLAHRFSFCSTGGGATLALVAGDRLPGLEALGYYQSRPDLL